MKNLTNTTLGLLFAFALCPFAAAQEVDKSEEPPDLMDNPLTQQAPQEEIVELFKEVELKLRRIDRWLLDASTGDTSALDKVTDSGIDELLDQATSQPPSGGGAGGGLSGMLSASEQEGQSVLSGIDRIIEIAQENGGSAAGACSKPDPNKPSPLDRGEQRTDKQSTPEEPKSDPNQQQEDEHKEPKNPQESKAQDQNKPSPKTPDQETEDPNLSSDDLEHWGDLPIHVRDIFRAEGGKKMPSQYRDWIDSYYRRLNARSGN